MKHFLKFAAASALMLAAVPTAAEPADIAAAIANPDRAPQDTALDEGRQPAAVLGFFGLERGDTVLDVLAGGGYYTELMARAVGPEGFVLGQNPPPLIVQFNLAPAFEARGYGERVPNAAQFNLDFEQFVLPPESIDFALFHMVFHDLWYESEYVPLTDPADFVARLYRAMKPGGTVGIVDHVGREGVPPSEEVNANHRIDPAVIRSVMTDAGFVFEDELDILRNPADDHQTSVFDLAIRGQTDRVVYRFRKPADEI